MNRGWACKCDHGSHQPAQGTPRPLRLGVKKNGVLKPLAID